MQKLSSYDPQLTGLWWVSDDELGGGDTCHVYVLDNGRALWEAGNSPDILYVLDREFDVNKLEAVILSHSHFDHVGGLAALLQYARPKIYIHQADLPHVKLGHYFLTELLKKVGKEEYLVPLKGGERLPFMGELEVIAAPGHTLGAICLYHAPSRTLFSGDTVYPATPETDYLSYPDDDLGDLDALIDSLKRLTAYPVKNLLPSHRKPVFADGSKEIKNAWKKTREQGRSGKTTKDWH